MWEKIMQFLNKEERAGKIVVYLLLSVMGILAIMLAVAEYAILDKDERIVCVTILAVFLAMALSLSYVMVKTERKGKMICEENLQEKVDEYTQMINKVLDEEKHERNILNTNWVQDFEEFMYDIQPLDDFGVAACLVYSLTGDNDTDEAILFAFDCAKKIISEPREYGRGNVFCYNTWLKTVNEKVNIRLPNESFTAEALASIIRVYLKDKTFDGVNELSNFLRILYLECK